MTDIVERLRKMATCIYIATEKTVADDVSDGLLKAADEIERLRKDKLAWHDVVASQQAEIERLRHEVRRLEDALETRRRFHARQQWTQSEPGA